MGGFSCSAVWSDPVGRAALQVQSSHVQKADKIERALMSTRGMPSSRRGAPGRVAVISLHTSPTDQPGSGDSGGMNVYILSVARRLAEQGIEADICTRCRGDGAPQMR